ncbi:MAG TPA: M24 family metallopeptidase, partial [Longimicrobiales bacterium]|nr:M24 family metallopeptidase [Longimicrobiales bacterium]
MEVSERDGVPFVDLVPGGVVQLVESCGVRVVSSDDLVSRTCARWGERGLETHRRAAAVLADVARETWERAMDAVRSGRPVDERTLADGVLRRLAEEGLEEVDTIVAVGPNSGLPHYAPPEEGSRAAASGDVFLIDLWGRVADDPDAVFADQTWMGVLGTEPPEGFSEAWRAVRDARDAVVELLRDRAEAAEPVTGAEADLRAREVLEGRGFGAALLHRTGHGIDRALHGFGPNLDAVET